jgi:uncharacterized protein
MNISEELLRELIMLAAVSPMVILGLRQSSSPEKWKLIGRSVMLVLVTDLATCMNHGFNIKLAQCIQCCFGLARSAGLEWNWAGKAFCILTIVAFFIILPSDIRRRSGLLGLPSRDSALPVIGYLASCVVISLLGAFAPEYPLAFNTETFAYQALMPSLAEEPVFRGILPALLAIAMGSPWRIAGAQLGWWWLAISFYFGLGHAIGWSSQGAFQVDAFTLVAVTILTLPDGWVAARSGSVWPSVIGHSLTNSTYVGIGLLANTVG